MKYTVLFVRKDSAYKKRKTWDAYDADRNALEFKGGTPCVCHPPCRKWGILAHMATSAKRGEKWLAVWSVVQVRLNGGILEHPATSRLFKKYLPDTSDGVDTYGGFTIEVDQFDFGHVAHKRTKLYICGISKDQLPALPPTRNEPTDRSICGNVAGTKRCTQYQREYTPEDLIDWFEKVLDLIKENKSKNLN
jgi:hypothetical protein